MTTETLNKVMKLTDRINMLQHVKDVMLIRWIKGEDLTELEEKIEEMVDLLKKELEDL